MTLYKYLVYGLSVSSTIEIPELKESSADQTDVYIEVGEVPPELPGEKTNGVFYQAGKDDFLLRMDEVGAFRVQAGNQITVQPYPEHTPELLRVYLMGSVFGALLHQRGILAFHGSAVDFGHGTIILMGKSSSGKSTLAASLVERGYNLITDDISAVHQNKAGFFIHPGIPQIRLWKDVVIKMGIEEELIQVRPSVEKYIKRINQGFNDQPSRISGIGVLLIKNTPGMEVNEVYGFEKFQLLKENTYRYQFLRGLQKTTSHFNALAALANEARVFKIHRPSTPLLIDDLTDKVIEIFSHLK